MDHISRLEHASVHILREAYKSFDRLGMLWSIGKDSSVLVWLARKAFFGHVPFPVMHVDTTYKIPEMITYRDKLAKEWKLDLRYATNEEAIRQGQTFPLGAVDRINCCKLLKTKPLADLLKGKGNRYRMNHATGEYEPYTADESFDGVIVGLRADEEGSRSKERYFSPRDQRTHGILGRNPPSFGISSILIFLQEPMCESIRFWIGLRQISGNTFNGKRFPQLTSITIKVRVFAIVP